MGYVADKYFHRNVINSDGWGERLIFHFSNLEFSMIDMLNNSHK